MTNDDDVYDDDADDLLSEVDYDALKRALEMTLNEPNADRVAQVKSMLEDRDELEVARFAAYHQQVRTLGLTPLQAPPCSYSIDHAKAICAAGPKAEFSSPWFGYRGAKLLLRMLAHGVSQFEPDPISALKAQGARRRT